MVTHHWKSESLQPEPNVHTRPTEMKFVSEIPKEAGDLVATCIYNDHLIVACQYGVFRLVNDTLEQIKFKL